MSGEPGDGAVLGPQPGVDRRPPPRRRVGGGGVEAAAAGEVRRRDVRVSGVGRRGVVAVPLAA